MVGIPPQLHTEVQKKCLGSAPQITIGGQLLRTELLAKVVAHIVLENQYFSDLMT